MVLANWAYAPKLKNPVLEKKYKIFAAILGMLTLVVLAIMDITGEF